MSRARRTAARILRALGIAAIALVVVVVVLLALLHTPPGERVVAALLVSRVEDRIAGKLSISDLEFRLDGVELRRAELRTPEGETVVTADRVAVDLSLLSLLRGEVRIDRLLVVAPHAHLWKRDDQQWSLAAALERRRPPGEPTPIRIGALRVQGGAVDVQIPTPKGGTTDLRLRDLQASAGDLRYRGRLVSGVATIRARSIEPSRAALAIEARASADDDRQALDLEASLGEGVVSARLRLPPRSRKGPLLGSLAASLRVDIPAFQWERTTYGPVHVTAALENERLRVPRAHVQLPGLTMSSTEASDSALAGTIDIESVGETLQALEALAARDLPDVRGNGKINFRVGDSGGPIRLAVTANLARLSVANTRAADVRVHSRISDLARPLEQAQVSIEVGSVTTDERRFKGLSLELVSAGRNLAVDAAMKQPRAARLHLRGTLSRRYRVLRSNRIAISYPRATWRSDRTATFTRAEKGGVLVENFGLRSGDQRVALDATWTPAVKKMSASISRLQLARIPLPAPARRRLRALSARGVLDAEVQAMGPADALEGTVHASLSRGRIGALSGLSGSVDARFAGGRAHGSFSAEAPPASLWGSFDLPMRASPPPHTPIAASVDVKGLELGRLWRTVRGALPAGIASRIGATSGLVSASARVNGTVQEPAIRGDLALRGGRVEVEGVGRYQLALAVEGTERQIRIRELAARTRSGFFEVSGQAVRRGAGLRYHYRLRARAVGFPIPLDDPVDASLGATLTGVASQDRVTCTVDVRDVRVVPRPAAQEPTLTRLPSPAGTRARRGTGADALR